MSKKSGRESSGTQGGALERARREKSAGLAWLGDPKNVSGRGEIFEQSENPALRDNWPRSMEFG